MSKRLPKRKFIGRMKQPQELRMSIAQQIAPYAKRAMDHLAPLVRAEKMPVSEAMVLIAIQANINMQGNKEASMTMRQIHQMCDMIIDAWRQKIFTPCNAYPYTLEQTLEAMNGESL